MDLGIAGRAAAVGGGSKGLGFASARALALEGVDVAICARGGDELRRAAATLEDAASRVAEAAGRRAPRVVARTADLTDPEQCHGFVDDAAYAFGRLDILVANCGGPPAGRAQDFAHQEWEAGLGQSLLSTIDLCTAALAHMRSRRWGRIVAVTSFGVREPVPGLALSNVARAGVAGYAKTLAGEVASEGITVNLACPGLHRTDRLLQLAGGDADLVGEHVSRIPVGRLGDPAEFGALVAFLASGPAAFITGQAVVADGGQLRSIL